MDKDLTGIEPEIIKDMENLLNIVFENSLFNDKINRDKLHSEILEILRNNGQDDIYKVYDLVIDTLRKLGDNHSKIRRADFTNTWKSKETSIKEPEFRIVENACVIYIPQFIGVNEERCISYASKLQDILRENDGNSAGWILDLRGNGGGNMTPIIVGLGPLYDSETIGYFKDPTGRVIPWGYKNGAYVSNGNEVWNVVEPYKIRHYKPIALLLDGNVASSAEMVAISFKGNKNTRFFGTSTKGYTTANESFELTDGSLLSLAVASTLSRDKTEYTGVVDPDELTDTPLEDAVLWINSFVESSH